MGFLQMSYAATYKCKGRRLLLVSESYCTFAVGLFIYVSYTNKICVSERSGFNQIVKILASYCFYFISTSGRLLPI
jgi:hypothetical protein